MEKSKNTPAAASASKIKRMVKSLKAQIKEGMQISKYDTLEEAYATMNDWASVRQYADPDSLRIINTISRMINKKADFYVSMLFENPETRLDEMLDAALDNLVHETPNYHAHVEVIGSHNQYFNWVDPNGWEYNVSGDIVDWSRYIYEKRTKIELGTTIDSNGRTVMFFTYSK